MAGKGNNTAGRNKTTSYKTIDGRSVIPVLYAGKNAGHGKTYMTGSVDNKLVVDASGRPIPYKAIIGDVRIAVSM